MLPQKRINTSMIATYRKVSILTYRFDAKYKFKFYTKTLQGHHDHKSICNENL